MRVAIRADASERIGAGHVMRDAALAESLRDRGAEVRFLCRDLPRNLVDWLQEQGWPATRLAAPTAPVSGEGYAAWLGVSSDQDAEDTLQVLRDDPVDWLVVDHYALGAAWEGRMRPVARHILAVDDLADRPHDCDLLLDQNYAHPGQARYAGLVPPGATIRLGPRHALLRRQFAALRAAALARRDGRLERVLVFMGGADPGGETEKALSGLLELGRGDLAVDVVVGNSNPRRGSIADWCGELPGVRFQCQTPHMAELMAEADLGLGAGGSAAWERCVLGLPAIVAVLADNQAPIAGGLGAAGVHVCLGRAETLTPADYAAAVAALRPERLRAMSRAAAQITDGLGAPRLATEMLEWEAQHA
jgi:UDP-2,4-diacetamido-2,4,6-trideoxy-beta-L-altropyranose hydrolase